MSGPARTSRVTFIVLRYMRMPIMVLIAAYAIAMAGWVVIPGIEVEGEPQALSFFHAFYFLTYTATTTGFGELPIKFTDAQRMWGIVCLYGSVVAWLYAVGAIIRLLQNPNFQQAIAERRFAKRVRGIIDPFFIVCGFGNTGSLLVRGLSDAGISAVVIDQDSERIKALLLRDYQVDIPGLCAEARVPGHLIDAGLLRDNCKGVVALTHDEEVNLKISVTARLLNPGARVVTQSTSPDYEETLSTLGDDIHIIDPFQTFAKYLGATIDDPAIHTLNQWLAGSPQASLDKVLDAPSGRWILCGYGRMGRSIKQALEALGITVTVIEPHPADHERGNSQIIVGRATRRTLLEAGIKEASGIVVGTDSDSKNLGILINAKALNPGIFLIVRQNQHRNEVVFQAGQADFIMQPSLVTARRTLFLLIAPLLKTFFESLRDHDASTQSVFLMSVISRLQELVGGTRPRLWTLDVGRRAAGALLTVRRDRGQVTLRDLLRDPSDRERPLSCLPMVVESGADTVVMPDLSMTVEPGQQILFCGTNDAYHLLDATLNNEYTLHYLITGRDEPRGIAMKWLVQHWPRLQSAA